MGNDSPNYLVQGRSEEASLRRMKSCRHDVDGKMKEVRYERFFVTCFVFLAIRYYFASGIDIDGQNDLYYASYTRCASLKFSQRNGSLNLNL